MHTDFLFIVAEIGAAFAGFASLVAAISRLQSDTPESAHLDFGTLQRTLVISLLAIAFALLPSVIARQAVDPEIAWRSSAAAFCVTLASYMAYVIRGLPRAYRATERALPFSVLANFLVGGGGVLVLALCAMGILPTSSYLVTLSILLYLAGFTFLRFFVSIGQRSDAA